MMEDDYLPSWENNLFSIKLNHGGKFTPSPKRMYGIDGKVNYGTNIEVEPLQLMELHMFLQEFGWLGVAKSSKSLALGWINEADENVHEEQTVNVNDYTIDDRFELDIYENLNLDDYIVYVNENMNENVNVDENMNENVNADDENVNADDENVNADDEYEQDDVEDKEVIGNDREDFIVDEEHVIDEVEVNMEGDDTASITRRSLRASGKDGFRASRDSCPKELDRLLWKNYSDMVLVMSVLEMILIWKPIQTITFLTDRQNGLLPALKDLFLAAEHIYYVRHIHDNMNMIYKGGYYKELLWKCATATTKVHFERAMDEFKGYNRLAHEWLRKIPPKHWIRSQFSGKENRDLLINNICEVFNRQLLEARDSPVITALEYVREYLNEKDSDIIQKINLVPGREFWEKSQVLSRLIPPYIPPQVGRPGKKRKKSAGEVTEMVKDGKLIRKGDTVTCCKCGKRGTTKEVVKEQVLLGSGSASQPPRVYKLKNLFKVWILQISQENGQNRTNTDTGTDKVYKSRENAFKCMRTRNSNFLNNPNVTIPRRQNRGRAPNIVEPELRTIVEVAPMAERIMEEILRAPTEGYGEGIV
ncbi:hypothetical protein Tco_0445714 [Tanacetum coccineum]